MIPPSQVTLRVPDRDVVLAWLGDQAMRPSTVAAKLKCCPARVSLSLKRTASAYSAPRPGLIQALVEDGHLYARPKTPGLLVCLGEDPSRELWVHAPKRSDTLAGLTEGQLELLVRVMVCKGDLPRIAGSMTNGSLPALRKRLGILQSVFGVANLDALIRACVVMGVYVYRNGAWTWDLDPE